MGVQERSDLEDQLQDLYRLTPAEVRVALLLVEGMAPKEIAVSNQVTINTVRTQIKSLLNKTGTRRQAEFVAEMYRRLAASFLPHPNG
jgi:DNA-binding CsgD family transcriptional regulator